MATADMILPTVEVSRGKITFSSASGFVLAKTGRFFHNSRQS